MPAFIVRSVTLPKELIEFAESKIKQLSKDSGEPENMSKYVRDLIRSDKESSTKTERKKAAYLSRGC